MPLPFALGNFCYSSYFKSMKTKLSLAHAHGAFSQWLDTRNLPAWSFWTTQILFVLCGLAAIFLGALLWFGFFFLGASWGPHATIGQLRTLDPLLNSMFLEMPQPIYLQIIFRTVQLLTIVQVLLAVLGSFFAIGGAIVLILLYHRARYNETLSRARQFCGEVEQHLAAEQPISAIPSGSRNPMQG